MSKGEIIILLIVFFLSMVAWIIGRHAPSRHSDIWSGENDDLDDVDK